MDMATGLEFLAAATRTRGLCTQHAGTDCGPKGGPAWIWPGVRVRVHSGFVLGPRVRFCFSWVFSAPPPRRRVWCLQGTEPATASDRLPPEVPASRSLSPISGLYATTPGTCPGSSWHSEPAVSCLQLAQKARARFCSSAGGRDEGPSNGHSHAQGEHRTGSTSR